MQGKCNNWMRIALFSIVFSVCATAEAATYTLNGTDRPALCSGQVGSWSGNTYVCNWGQPFRVAAGDAVVSTRPQIKILSYSGFDFVGSTIGGSGYVIDLEAQGSNETKLSGSILYGSIVGSSNNVRLVGGTTINGSISVTGTFSSNASTITGNVSANNGITAADTIFQGNLTTSSGGISLVGGEVTNDVLVTATNITANDTVFRGALTSTNGAINLTGGSVEGLVKTNCCTITTNGSNLSSGAQANSGITIDGGTIAGGLKIVNVNGGFVNNNIVIKNAIMPSGDINAFNVQVSNSQIGTAQTPVEIIARGNYLNLVDNTTVYGHVEVTNTYGTITIEPGSRVVGTCLADTNRNPNVNNNVIGECGGEGETAIHHYELSYSSGALTCQPHEVTIKACTNADCSATYSDGPSRISLSPAGWNMGSFTFTGSTKGTLAVRREGIVSLGITGNPEPVAEHSLKCRIDGMIYDECPLHFAKSRFLVEISDFISGDSVGVTIQAVEAKKDSPQECSPAFDSGTRTLNFWSNYVEPNGEVQVGNQFVSIIDGPDIGKSPETATSIALTFGPNATTYLNDLTYPDAGEMALHVSYSGTGDEEGLSMEGQGGFIVTPAQLKVEASTVDGQLVSCSDPMGDFDTDCRKFVAAGEEFSLHVKALSRAGNETANFRHGNVTVEVVPTAVYPNGTGAELPVLTPANYEHGLENTNTFTSKPSVDEVGIVKLKAVAKDYLKADNHVEGTSDWVGRFFPAWLEVGARPSQSIGCPSPSSLTSNFTYQGQPALLTGGLEVRGFNKNNAQTQNYKGDFWRFTGTLEFEEREGTTIYELHQASATPEAGQLSAIDGRIRPVSEDAKMPVFIATPSEAAFLPGSDAYSYTRPSTPTELDNPFSLKMVIWNWHDQDGVYFKRDDEQPEDERGFEPDGAVPVEALIGTSEFRLGRIRTQNIIDPGLGEPPIVVDIPLRLEHWEDSGFVLASDDCTSVESVIESVTSNLTSAEVVEQVDFSAESEKVEKVQVRVSGPENRLNGSVSIKSLLSVKGATEKPYWLCQAGIPIQGGVCTYSTVVNEEGLESVEVRADATATFGIYQGPKPLIFRRELYRGM